MSDSRERLSDLVPRVEEQGYAGEAVAARRRWIEERTGAHLEHVGATTVPSEEMRGNVENPIGAVQVPLGAVAGASVSADGYEGTALIVVDTEREVLVGATFVGPEVAELLHAATIAVVGEVPLRRLWHAVPAYPTVSEVWLRLLEAYGL